MDEIMKIDELLSSADPAAQVPDDLGDGPRGREALARAMAQDPERRTKGGSSRALKVAAAVVVGGGAVWAGSGLLGSPAAEAGWSATPQPPGTSEEKAQAQKCLDMGGGSGGDGSRGHEFSPALVEVRGDFAFSVVASDDGQVRSCLLPLRRLDAPVQGIALTAPDEEPPAENTIISRGAVGLESDDGTTRSAVTGRVGDQVQSVHVLVDGRQVESTVRDGRFAAWWPAAGGILPSLREPDPDVTITLRDGTTRTASLSEFRPARF